MRAMFDHYSGWLDVYTWFLGSRPWQPDEFFLLTGPVGYAIAALALLAHYRSGRRLPVLQDFKVANDEFSVPEQLCSERPA